jgi:hypothetical protein
MTIRCGLASVQRQLLPPAFLVLAVCLCEASVGRCDDTLPLTNPPAALRAPPPTRWYGPEIFLSDSVSMLLVAIQRDHNPSLSVVTAVVVPPLIHVLHHNTRGAAWSLVTRLSLPLGLAMVGYYTADCPDGRGHDGCGIHPELVGLGIGLAGATVIDMFLARAPVTGALPPPVKSSSGSHSFRFSGAGVAAHPGGGASLVVGGLF